MTGRAGVLVLALLLAALPAAVPVDATDGAHERFVLRFHDEVPSDARPEVLDELGLSLLETLPSSPFVLVAGDRTAAREASAHDAVSDIRPPQVLRASATPDDPLFPIQWHLRAVQAPDAWELSTGTGVVVAILDTGVTPTLSDLAGVGFAAGFDFVNGDTDPVDDHGHGSHVAGTVAQATGNGVGGAGVAPDATIMPVKVLDGAGAGEDWNVAQGLHWAADNGAAIVNLSLGGDGSPVLEEAVSYATARGVTLIAATGNRGATTPDFPAAYPAVIAVGAVRYDRSLAEYSNRGAAVELVAPGGDVSVDQNGDGYGDGVLQQTVSPGAAEPTCFCFYQGTSMAAPHVAGVAALLAAAGTRDPAAIREALTTTALDLGPAGRDDRFGFGLVQARAALEAAPAADPSSLTPPPPPSGETGGLDPPDTEGATGSRDIEDVCPTGEVPPHGYDDVPEGGVHEHAIACVSWYDIVSGRAPSTYDPAGEVRRDQMAAFLARTLAAVGTAMPSSPPDAFHDDGGSVHRVAIDRLAALGIVSGTVDGAFRPADTVTRGQMASFLVRAMEHVVGEPVNARLDQFDDDDGNVHEPRIDAVATAGVAAGTGFRTFAPGSPVRRAQVASFLARVLDYLADNGHAPGA